MTSMKEKEFLDESHKWMLLIDFLDNERYREIFLFLYDMFEENTCVTAKDIAKSFFIHNYSRAFQILESFVVMTLLRKTKTKGSRKSLFLKNNPELWERLIKEGRWKKRKKT